MSEPTDMFPLSLNNSLERGKVRDSLRWDHQYKQQAEKCLLFLYFPSLSAVSNVRFSKIAVFVIFTNLTHQLSLFFNNLLFLATYYLWEIG